MGRWLIGARPEGFSTVTGTVFRFVGKPRPGWSGIVTCEVTEVREPELLRYSWRADGGAQTTVLYRLDRLANGTRFTFEHEGFTGLGGFIMAKLFMPILRRRMFGARLQAVLQAIQTEAPPNG